MNTLPTRRVSTIRMFGLIQVTKIVSAGNLKEITKPQPVLRHPNDVSKEYIRHGSLSK